MNKIIFTFNNTNFFFHIHYSHKFHFMKIRFAPVFLVMFLFLCSFSKTEEVVIPYGTTITVTITGDVTLNSKVGSEVATEVKEDVKVKGVVVVSKGTPVKATIRTNNKPKTNYYTTNETSGELLIDFVSTKAVDGTEITFNGCYLQYFAEKNNNWFDKNKKWLPVTGAIKNCESAKNVTVKTP